MLMVCWYFVGGRRSSGFCGDGGFDGCGDGGGDCNDGMLMVC